MLEHRAATSAGKPVSILRVKVGRKFAAVFFCSTCLDCFMIFAPTRHECVIVFLLNASAPFLIKPTVNFVQYQ